MKEERDGWTIIPSDQMRNNREISLERGMKTRQRSNKHGIGRRIGTEKIPVRGIGEGRVSLGYLADG